MGSERAAVFAVIFPANLPFFESYLKSLIVQDERSFDVVLLVDQVHNIETIIEPYRDQLTIHTYAVSVTITAVREKGLQLLRTLPYRYILFSDTDDVFSSTRVRTCLTSLIQYPIVVNDLAPFSKEGEWSSTGFWASRLGQEFVFSAADIARYNFVGLGNTSIRKDLLLNTALEPMPENLMAPDWFIFFQMLQGVEGVFLQQGSMHYRQHTQNLGGLGVRVDEKRLQHILNTKISHYKALSKRFPEMKKLQLENQIKQQRAQQEQIWLEQFLNNVNSRSINYFWWEETEYSI